MLPESLRLSFIVDETKRPKHVIFIGLDGMRYDYLEHYPLPHIKSLIENGVSLRNAITSNFPAATAPGFASLGTGVVSRKHGIYASNEWYDKKTGKLRYFYDEQQGKLDLKAPTLCDEVKTVNPEAKVVSVSTKDRPALLLAGENADIVAYSYRRKHSTKEQVAQGRTREAVSGAGVHEDYYCWVERPNYQLPAYLKDRRLIRNVDWRGPGFHHPNIDVRYTPMVDNFVMDAALDLIRNEQPYLTFVAMESVDHDAQAYSMDSSEVMTSLETIDTGVGRLIQLLKEIDWYEDTLVVISAEADAVTVPAGYENPVYLYGHGCPYPADSNIIMVFSGAGAKKLGTIGEHLDLSSQKLFTDEEVENLPEQIDVVPTMKSIMGLPISFEKRDR